MKIYVATDLEGATGVFKFAQTRERGTPAHAQAFRFLMDDIAAVCRGLREAGADEIYVLDGHNGGNNFLPDRMVPGARYITGKPRPPGMTLLDESFDGMVLLGYHAMNGTPDGVLHHTQSSKAEAKYWYDGVERGEIYQHALIGGHYGVPVILATGDEATCREAREHLDENLPTVATKRGLSREAAVLLAPEETADRLAQGARKAMEEISQRKPLKVKLPIKAKKRRLGPNSEDLANPYFVEKSVSLDSQLSAVF